MRNNILYLTLLLAVLLSSCNDWLDVKPKTQVDVNEMFQKEEGFRDALTACYIKLNDRKLYGEQMTMTTVEYLAQHWSLNTSNYREENKLKDFDFDTDYARTSIIAIYGSLYNVIAQANIVLENLAENGHVIASPAIRATIEAEALAIRAFCHLDILRLFGQMPQGGTTAVNLTYVKTVSHDALPLYNFSQFTELILADITAAEALLKEHDPVLKFTFEELSIMKFIELEDTFLGYRRFRFNYYAVQAMKARLYMYMGDKPNAYAAAKAVIDAKTKEGRPVMVLAGGDDFASQYFALPSECLLALNNFKLVDYVNKLITTNGLRETPDRLKKDIFVGQSDAVNNRYINMWVTTGKDNQGAVRPIIRKYETLKVGESMLENNKTTQKEIIPLIRLSEMYLIAIESASALVEANTLYQEYMRARNVSVTPLDAAGLQEEVVREYRREFYAEGQMFYTYKRLGIKQMLWKADRELTERDYIIPRPTSEFNN